MPVPTWSEPDSKGQNVGQVLTPERLLDAQTVAEILGVHLDSLYRQWRQGIGPPLVHVGRACRVSPTALEQYIAQGGSR
jgi:predicted DNA-binding transcriptional regulator AlpA